MSNRRRSERYKIELPVRLKDSVGGEESTTCDISAHGIAILVKRMRTLREYVELDITLPRGGPEIHVTALVARIIDGLELSSGQRGRGLGLDFFLFDARAKGQWQRFIQEIRAEQSGPTSTLPASTKEGGEEGEEPASTFLVRPRDIGRLQSFFRREMEKGLLRIETPIPKQIGEPVEILVVHPTTLAEWSLQGRVLRSLDRRTGRPVLEITLVALDEATRAEFKRFVSSGEGMIVEDVPISTDLPMLEPVLEPVLEPLARTGSGPDLGLSPPVKIPTSDLTIPEPALAGSDVPTTPSEPNPDGPEDEKTVSVVPSIPRAISIAAAQKKDLLEESKTDTDDLPGYGADPKSLSGKLFSSFFFEAAESEKPKKALRPAPRVVSSPDRPAPPKLEVKPSQPLQALRPVSAPKPAAPPVARPTPVFPQNAILPHPTPVLPLVGGAAAREPSKPDPKISRTRTPPPLPPRPSNATPILRGAAVETGPDPKIEPPSPSSSPNSIPAPARSGPLPPPPPPPDPMPPPTAARRPQPQRHGVAEASTGAHRTVSTASADPGLDRDIAIARARVVRSPNSVTACYRLGTLLLRRGDLLGFGEAINTLQRVMELEPNHPGAHHAVAEAFARRGDFTSAAEHLQRARRLGYQIDPDLERAVIEGKRTL